MKREKLYCLLLSIIATILIFILTFKLIPLICMIPIFIMYLALTSVISTSILGIIKNRKSKENWCGLLAGVSGLMSMIIYMIGSFGKMNESMRSIVTIIALITFLLFTIICGLWIKFEKNK